MVFDNFSVNSGQIQWPPVSVSTDKTDYIISEVVNLALALYRSEEKEMMKKVEEAEL